MSEADEIDSYFSSLRERFDNAIAFTSRLQRLLERLSVLKEDIDMFAPELKIIASGSKTWVETYNLVYSLFAETKENATTILLTNVTRALETSEEFSRQPFYDLLVNACRDPSVFSLKLLENGWNSSIEVEIDMDSVAGSLEQWASGVTRYRTILKGSNKKKNTDPIVSSSLWRDSIYGGKSRRGDLWTSTIQNRLSLSGAPAPFWRLLNNGNIANSMSSDRGGFPTPKNAPTWFVELTIEDVVNEFRYLLKTAKADDAYFRTRAKEVLSELDSLRLSIDNLVLETDEKVAAGVEENESFFPEIERNYGTVIERADKHKVSIITDELATDGEISSYRVTKDGRVEVTPRGSKKRVRISVGKLKSFLAGG